MSLPQEIRDQYLHHIAENHHLNPERIMNEYKEVLDNMHRDDVALIRQIAKGMIENKDPNDTLSSSEITTAVKNYYKGLGKKGPPRVDVNGIVEMTEMEWNIDIKTGNPMGDNPGGSTKKKGRGR